MQSWDERGYSCKGATRNIYKCYFSDIFKYTAMLKDRISGFAHLPLSVHSIKHRITYES